MPGVSRPDDRAEATPSRPGRRALAVRLIEETGGRAVGSPVAEVLHPAAPERHGPALPLGKVPGDVVRRAIGKLNRLAINRAGGLVLRSRRVSNADLVHAIHLLERRVDELEQRLAREAREDPLGTDR